MAALILLGARSLPAAALPAAALPGGPVPSPPAPASPAAALATGEVCFLPPELAARLDAGWDPVALSHAPEAARWRDAAATAETLAGRGPRPTHDVGWALVLARVGEDWSASVGEVWLDQGPVEGALIHPHATADRLTVPPVDDLCPGGAGGVDLRRVSGALYRGDVCGETRDLVLTASFPARRAAWSRAIATRVVEAAAAARTADVVGGPHPRVHGAAVSCEAAAYECDAERLVAWCSARPASAGFWEEGWILAPAPDGGPLRVLPGGDTGMCALHGITGASPARDTSPPPVEP